MARTKFTFEKRQRELAKKQKKVEKAARRAEAKQEKGETEEPLTGEALGVNGKETGHPADEESPGHGDEAAG